MTFTFAYYDAIRRVGAQAVGCDALVLAGVGGHRVHDLDGDDAVRVRDRILVRLQLLPALEPFDLQDANDVTIVLHSEKPSKYSSTRFPECVVLKCTQSSCRCS